MEVSELPGKRNRGLTLIELMVAMTILAFAAVAGVMVLVQSHKANNASQAKTRALYAAEQELERIFQQDPSWVTNFVGNPQAFDVDGLQAPGGGQAGLVTVTGADPFTVTVTIQWQGGGTLAPGQVMLSALRSTAPR